MEFTDKLKPFVAQNGKIINVTSSAGKFGAKFDQKLKD